VENDALDGVAVQVWERPNRTADGGRGTKRGEFHSADLGRVYLGTSANGAEVAVQQRRVEQRRETKRFLERQLSFSVIDVVEVVFERDIWMGEIRGDQAARSQAAALLFRAESP
jgi:hypothetical protein